MNDGAVTDPPQEPAGDEVRSVAQLNMLHGLGAQLNTLNSVEEIARAITDGLKTIIDYHNCRVYVLLPDGVTLMPIAFRGELFSGYEGYLNETPDELIALMGEGITGHVAATRTSLLAPDARDIPFSITIPGTEDDLLESMLAVPVVARGELMGVIVLSSLGYGMFDEDDQRMLEVLAAHAGAAFQNARLLTATQEAADAAAALLRLSQALTLRRTVADILQEAVETVPSIVPCVAAGAYERDPTSGAFRLVRLHAMPGAAVNDQEDIAAVPAPVAERFLTEDVDPFVIPADVGEEVPAEYHLVRTPGDTLVAPLRWEPDGFGAIVAIAAPEGPGFGTHDTRLARGIADITSLALGTARRLTELERFHELVESLVAVFWEAELDDRRLTFVGGRAEEILGTDATGWVAQSRRWGDHVLDDDREAALAACERAVAHGADASIEYRVPVPGGDAVWIRDLIHVVQGAHGPRRLRGLMVDITERRLAEQALAASERKYSEAFRREREAAQRLRALDDMKNTFLEAVSHDLRTPLTSILGSALTLQQNAPDIEAEAAQDLVRRITVNARKLERLLGDLLDLDRLQRGIVSPQRRPTDLAALVARVVEEIENPHGHPIEVEATEAVVSLDAAKVERIVENLLNNALRHTDPSATVWLRASAQDGGALLITEDNGPGIPADLREAIFEPFRQAPGSATEHSPGVGVGLSLVKRFAELHGGRAWVQDREGGGASFRVFLPGG